jgi:hypothetical protein
LLNVDFVDLVAPNFVWEVAHLVLLRINRIFHCLVNVDLEGCLVDFLHGLPYFTHALPDLQKIVLVFLQTVKVVRITKLHVKEFFCLAHSHKLLSCLLDLLTKYLELICGLFNLGSSCFRPVGCLFRPVVLPLLLNLFDLGIYVIFLFQDLGLKQGNLLLHSCASL